MIHLEFRSVQYDGQGPVIPSVKVAAVPEDFPRPTNGFARIELDLNQIHQDHRTGKVRAAGRRLYDAIRSTDVRSSVGHAIDRKAGRETCAIGFEFGATGLHIASWESLWDTQAEFFSRHEHLPIVRLLPGAAAGVVLTFARPVTFAVIIDEGGSGDWQALMDALSGATFEWQVEVLTADAAVFVAARSLAAAGQPICADWVTTDTALHGWLAESKADIAHFHGHCRGTRLQLLPATGRPITLDAGQIGAAMTRQRRQMVWLTSLNCCGTGTGDVAPTGVGETLVTGGHAAVAVSMRELVDRGDASHFAEGMFTDLVRQLNDIRERLVRGQPVTCTAFDTLTAAGRQKITRDDQADRNPAWTIPQILRCANPPSFKLGVTGRPRQADRPASALPATNALAQAADDVLNGPDVPPTPLRAGDKLDTNGLADGRPVIAVLAKDVKGWADRAPVPPDYLSARSPAEPWNDVKTGWGVILPGVFEGHALKTETDLKYLPASLRELIRRRTLPDSPAPVYVLSKSKDSAWKLCHLPTREDLILAALPVGVGRGWLPKYLLIVASPREVPWGVQAELNGRHAVGRLDLGKEALDRYIGHLLDGWPTPAAARPVAVWTPAADPADVRLRLSWDALANGVFKALSDGTRPQDCQRADGPVAHLAKLLQTNPHLIVTTSHGDMSDAGNANASLGRPVDGQGSPFNPHHLLDGWQPDGAIWYAHACCSAGGDDHPIRDYLDNTEIARALHALGRNPCVAPLPTELLSADKPLRAFIGSVGPTFGWSLQWGGSTTRQTGELVRALSKDLRDGESVGAALHPWLSRGDALFHHGVSAERRAGQNEQSRAKAQAFFLAGHDVSHTLILGDPTVALA